MKNTDIIGLYKAIKICKKYKENRAADMLIDILDKDIESDTLETVPAVMTEKDADILGNAINICDKLEMYGTGDILLDAINNHFKM